MPRIDRLFLRLAALTLIFLYLVVIAGSVVRATGSGMGCPDWPKCFGYFIPPTDPSEVEFQLGHDYRKGQMIIVHDSLWRAFRNFRSGSEFHPSLGKWNAPEERLWEKYPVHDYAKFFVAQTWTEYINRLVGAANSFIMLLLFGVAALRMRRDTLSFLLLTVGLGVLAFVIWLGKVVVDTNLKPISITLHMMSALVLIGITIFAMARVRRNSTGEKRVQVSTMLYALVILSLLTTLDQVVFGTQVRQQIDTINTNMSGLSRETWIGQLNGIYLYHKIMAVVVVIINVSLAVIFWRMKPDFRTKSYSMMMLLLVLCEYGAGVIMHNFSVPKFFQPVHLVLAMILFGFQFGLLMRLGRRRN